jgi:hypothetical protein
MKSAYELAMERLAKSEPREKPLSAAQKARLAEIDLVFKGKWAERDLFLKQALEKALADGEAEAADQLRIQLAREKVRIEEDRDAEKEKVRRDTRD